MDETGREHEIAAVEAQVRRNVEKLCAVCGGWYRPAGGACIHEQRSELWRQRVAAAAHNFRAGVVAAARTGEDVYDTFCGVCGIQWQPGHTCIPQPTAQEVQAMREQASWLRVLEDVLDHYAISTALAAPASWEAV